MYFAGYPVIDDPSDVLDPSVWVDSRTYAFEALDGTDVLPFTGYEFIAGWGIKGLDLPDRELVEEEMPDQDGSDLLEVKIGPRDWEMPLYLGSDSGHLPYLNNRARMRSFFDHRHIDFRTQGGTFDLVARSVVGERRLRAAYVGGMNDGWQRDSSGSYWQKFTLRARSVRPYWQGERWSTPIIRRPTGASWFGRFPGQLGSSRALGANIPVTVRGDVDPWSQIHAMGPASSVTISAPGLFVSIPDGLGAGEMAVIDTDPALRRVDYGAMFGGVCDWSRVAPLTKWAPLTRGDGLITIDLQDATADSYAFVDGPSLYETSC